MTSRLPFIFAAAIAMQLAGAQEVQLKTELPKVSDQEMYESHLTNFAELQEAAIAAKLPADLQDLAADSISLSGHHADVLSAYLKIVESPSTARGEREALVKLFTSPRGNKVMDELKAIGMKIAKIRAGLRVLGSSGGNDGLAKMNELRELHATAKGLRDRLEEITSLPENKAVIENLLKSARDTKEFEASHTTPAK